MKCDLYGSALCVVVGAAMWAGAVEPIDGDRTMYVSGDRNAREGYFRTRRHVDEVAAAKDGTLEVRGFMLHVTGLPLKYGIEAGNFGPQVFYPPLRAGDVIPVLGRLSTVDVVKLPGPKTPAEFSFTRMEPPPMGLAVLRDGVAVPLGQGKTNFAVLRSTDQEGMFRLWVTAITPPADEKGKAVAKVEVELGKTSICIPATVRVGDVLMFGSMGHAVHAIVPRDPKSRAIGWVEFAPQALTPDEAVKVCETSGGVLVRPRKP